jgi:hypothetical protein
MTSPMKKSGEFEIYFQGLPMHAGIYPLMD